MEKNELVAELAKLALDKPELEDKIVELINSILWGDE